MKISQRKSNTLGLISSTLCLLHCLAVPIFLSFYPVILQYIEHDLYFLEYIFLISSYIAVYFSTKNSNITSIMKIIFYLVLTFLTLGILFEETIGWMQYLGYIGSVGLIIMHIINLRTYRKCQVQH